MATLGAEFATLRHRATDYSPSRGAADIELRELENEIASHRDRPSSVLLKPTLLLVQTGGYSPLVTTKRPSGFGTPAGGKQVCKLSGHKKAAYAVAFSRDSRWLISGSWSEHFVERRI